MTEDLKERARAGLAGFADGQLQTGNFLTAALYTSQLTFGEFNRKRAEANTARMASMAAWLATLNAEDRAQTVQRAEVAQQQAEAAAALLKAVGCAAGTKSRFVQAMCQ